MTLRSLPSPLLDRGEGRPDSGGATTSRWVIGLFLLDVLLQRLAVPGLPIALLLPVTLGWAVLAHRRRVVEIDPMRLIWWALACSATGLMLLLQPLVVAGPLISIPSWALVVVTSLPFALRVRDRSVATYTRMLRGAETIGCWLAVGCLAMTGTQLLGVPYRDVPAEVLPSTLLLTDFNNTYPYSYGSTLFRANAWIGLEPSFTSFQLGIALLASVLLRRSIWRTVLLVAGIASTAAGSGILLVTVGLFVLALYRRRAVMRRYVAPVVVLVGAVLATSFGQSLLGRSTEFSDPNSSTSLRAILPYDVLWPRWVAQTGVMLVGDGPGSSQVLATSTGIGGLLVPTPVKIFFDYGLLGGAVLAAFLLACYVRSPSVSIAVALLLSLWTVQPGLTTTALLLNAVIFVSLWVPRVEPPLEARPPTPRDEAPAEQGA